MKNQLVDCYLHDSHCRPGIYLVGWFKYDRCDKSNARLRKSPSELLVEFKQRLNKQAVDLSIDGLRLQSFILDATLRRE